MTVTARADSPGTWRPHGADVALAAGLAVLAAVTNPLVAVPSDRPWWPGGALLVALGAVALAWRQRAPLTVLAAVVVVVAPYFWAGYPDGAIAFMLVVAVYTVATRTGMRRAVVTGLVVLLAWVSAEHLFSTGIGTPSDGEHYSWLVAVVAAGIAVGGLRRAALEAAERAEEQARRRVESERLRIAREVHDVVSHSLASIALQAGVGAHVATRHSEQAVTALHEIRDVSRAALDDLRAVISVLRDEDDADTPRPPSLSRRRLTDGIDEARRAASLAGVDVTVHGEAGPLPSAVDETAFRIVREAVTNTLRHARGPTRVEIDLLPRSDGLALRIRDDGAFPTPTGSTAGHGLLGLAEQAADLGGHLHAGPGEEGFVVEALLRGGSRP